MSVLDTLLREIDERRLQVGEPRGWQNPKRPLGSQMLETMNEMPVQLTNLVCNENQQQKVYEAVARFWYKHNLMRENRRWLGFDNANGAQSSALDETKLTKHNCLDPEGKCTRANVIIEVVFKIHKSMQTYGDKEWAKALLAKQNTIEHRRLSNESQVDQIFKQANGYKTNRKRRVHEINDETKVLQDFELRESLQAPNKRPRRGSVVGRGRGGRKLSASRGITCVDCCRCKMNGLSRAYSAAACEDASFDATHNSREQGWQQYVCKNTLMNYYGIQQAKLLVCKSKLDTNQQYTHKELKERHLQTFATNVNLSNYILSRDNPRKGTTTPTIQSVNYSSQTVPHSPIISKQAFGPLPSRGDLLPSWPRKEKGGRVVHHKKTNVLSKKRPGTNPIDSKHRRSTGITSVKKVQQKRKVPILVGGDEQIINRFEVDKVLKGLKVKVGEVDAQVWDNELKKLNLKELEDGRIVTCDKEVTVYLFDMQQCECACCRAKQLVGDDEPQLTREDKHSTQQVVCCTHGIVKKSNARTYLQDSMLKPSNVTKTAEGLETSNLSKITPATEAQPFSQVGVCVRYTKDLRHGICFNEHGLIEMDKFCSKIREGYGNSDNQHDQDYCYFKLVLNDGYVCNQSHELHVCKLQTCRYVSENMRYSKFNLGVITCPVSGKILKEGKEVDERWAPSSVLNSSGPDEKEKKDKRDVSNLQSGHSYTNHNSVGSMSTVIKHKPFAYAKVGNYGRDLSACRSVACSSEKLRSVLLDAAADQNQSSARFKKLLMQEYPVNGPPWDEYVSFVLTQLCVLLSKERLEADLTDERRKGNAVVQSIEKEETVMIRNHVGFVKLVLERGLHLHKKNLVQNGADKSKEPTRLDYTQIYERLFDLKYLSSLPGDIYHEVYDTNEMLGVFPDVFSTVVTDKDWDGGPRMMDDKSFFYYNRLADDVYSSFYTDGKGVCYESIMENRKLIGVQKLHGLLKERHLVDLKACFPQVFSSLFHLPVYETCLMTCYENQLRESLKRNIKTRPNMHGRPRAQLLQLYAIQVVQLWCCVQELIVKLEGVISESLKPKIFPQFVLGGLYLLKNGIVIPGRLKHSLNNHVNYSSHVIYNECESVVLKRPDVILGQLLPREDSSFVKSFRSVIQTNKRTLEGIFLMAVDNNIIVPHLFDLANYDITRQHTNVYPSLQKLNEKSWSTIYGGGRHMNN